MMNIEAAKELSASSLWSEVCKEIDYRIYNEMQNLLSCDQEDLIKIRVKIKTMEELKKLPDTVISREE